MKLKKERQQTGNSVQTKCNRILSEIIVKQYAFVYAYFSLNSRPHMLSAHRVTTSAKCELTAVKLKQLIAARSLNSAKEISQQTTGMRKQQQQ